MSSAAGPLIKPLSMAKGCLTSLPSLFNTKTSFSFISLPSKPIKSLHFTCSSSSSSWVSVKYKNSSSSSVVAMVASTSDWAQQEEGTRGREESYSKPLEEDRLFVANLPYDVDSQKLAELFQEAGIVEIAEVIYNRQTGQSRGFGFVTMSSIEEADKAIEMFDRYSINGRLLTVSKAGEEKGFRPAQRRQNFDPALKLYVGNLPFHVDDARLQQIFSEVGKVAYARIITDGETGRSRGYGFVTMSTETEVEDAVTAFNGQDLDGRTIKVNRRDLF